MISRRLQQLSRHRQPGAQRGRASSAASSTSTLLEALLDEPTTVIDGARGGDRGGPGPRGRRARPLRLRARARARDALRGPEHEPPRAPAPPHRRGAGGRRRREPGRARLPLLRGPGARRPSATRSPPPSRPTAALAYEEAAEHYRRAGRRRLATRLALGAAELRAGDPAARETFAAAAELARERGRPRRAGRGRARLRRPPRRGGRDRPRGDRAARGGAGRRSTTTTCSPCSCARGSSTACTSPRERGARARAQRRGAGDGPPARRPARAAGRARGPPRRAAARRPPRRAAAR